jgi:hypothetical protein
MYKPTPEQLALKKHLGSREFQLANLDAVWAFTVLSEEHIHRSLPDPSEAVQLMLVNYNPNSLQYFKQPSDFIIWEAYNKNPDSVLHLEKLPNGMEDLVFLARPELFAERKKQPPELAMKLIRKAGSNIQYVKKPTKAMQLAAVSKNYSAIRYIDNPDEDVQMAAVQKGALAIRLIRNPTDSVKTLAALRR